MGVPQLDELKAFLSSPRKIAITNHVNPDGDAMGSALGWKLFLQGRGHEVKVVVPNDPPEFLRWMASYEDCIVAEYHMDKAAEVFEWAEVICCLDYNALQRSGPVLSGMISGSSARKVLIDHHREPETWPDDMYSDTSKGSTAEMIYDIIAAWGGVDEMNEDIASCLYTGIVTDSGSFRFPSTTSATHRAAAVLLEAGARPEVIHERIYDVNTRSRLRLLGYMLDHMEVMEDRGIAILHLPQQVMYEFGYTKGDSEGFVNYGLSMMGMRMSAFFREDGDVTKCSFRSKGDLDVNSFARKYFNGGGHLNAAGGLFEGAVREAIEHLRDAVVKENL